MEITEEQHKSEITPEAEQACITIDNREAMCIAHFAASRTEHKVYQLPVADFIVSRGSTQILIERKTIADLISSIKDSRYAEQKSRLIHERDVNGSRVMYIIEGTAHNDLAESAILSMTLRDNIHVIRTKNVAETCTRVVSIHKKLNTDTFYSQLTSPVSEGKLVFSEKASRKTNITPETCYLSMLIQIPGISMKTAMGIAAVYPCMADLLQGSVSILKDILINNRRLGEKRSTVIVNYLKCP